MPKSPIQSYPGTRVIVYLGTSPVHLCSLTNPMESKRVSTLTKHLVAAKRQSVPNEEENGSSAGASNHVKVVFESDQFVWASTAGSMDGIPKINQDAVVFAALKDGGAGATSCCLCDGHGEYGEIVSALVSQSLANGSAEKPEDEGTLSDQVQQLVMEKLGNASLYAGCTAVWVRKLGNAMRICNVGDSRCLVIDKAWKILFETRDHKPDDPDETKRIEKCGGVVTKRPGNVPRVAGLALSRAFGDFAASSSGVCAVPDITIFPDSSAIAHVFVASDGVFDVLNSKQVVAILCDGLTKKNQGMDMMLRNLVITCKHLWNDDTDGQYCDDITCALWSFE